MLESDYLQDTTNLPNVEQSTPDLTRQQLEAIRDEWLGPLLMQMRHQSEEVGRLEIQCRQFREQRDMLIVERDELREQLEAKPEPEPESDEAEPVPTTAMDVVLNLASQLRTAEGAVVTGIAIAIGLWIGIGLLTFAVLG
ncbi:MAG: hypothetical protein R3A46_07265 [Thermomicrobiales bacterium]